nr:hypothetical protein [Haliscomenobacter sp.]
MKYDFALFGIGVLQ